MADPGETRRQRASLGAAAGILAALLLSPTTPALAQEATDTTADSASSTAPSSVRLVGRRVAAVRVVTVDERMRPEAEAAVLLRRDDPYTLEGVRESLQNLYALGTVSAVQVHASEGSDGVEVVFVVQPRLRLYDVRFTGVLPWSGGRLRRALSLREGQPLEYGVAEDQAGRLQQALADDGYLMAEVTGSVLPHDTPTRGVLALHVEPGDRARLAELHLEGEPGLSEVEVRDALGLREGTPFRPRDLDEGLTRLARALQNRHYFHHSVEVVEQGLDLDSGSVTVTVEVQSGPRVNLEISGVGQSEHDLHDVLAIFEFATVDDWALKESRQQLVTYLQRRGYWRPLVSYSRNRDDQGRNVEVQFRILRGDKRSLRRIVFTGNEAVSDETLRGVIRTDTGGLFGGGRYIAEWWEQDREAVVTAYTRRGYREARIVEAPVGLEGDELVARMVIEEGGRSRVRELRLVVTSDFPTPGIDLERWRAQLELRTGGPYDPSAVRRDTDRLRGLLTNAGYPRALITGDAHEPEAPAPATPDAPPSAADGDAAGTTETAGPGDVVVTQRIQPGERVRIDRVLVTGNEDTRLDVIRRELGIVAGAPYSFADILESQSRLYRTGLFDEVDVAAALPDSLESDRSIVVRVHEAPPLVVSYGGGFDTDEKLRGIFSIAHENLFGRNQELNFSSRVSLREQRLRLLFREPYLFGRRLETTATTFYSDEREPAFDVRRYGGSANLLLRRRDKLNIIGRYTFRDVQTSNIDIDPALIERQDRSTRVGALGAALVYDTRPDPIDPRRGVYQTFDIDVASRRLGSARDFVTLFGRSFWYLGISDSFTLATALRGGVQIPYGGTDSVPLPERFFSGGSTSLRGFPLDSAGPVDSRGNPLGGEAVVVANLEARYDLWGDLGVVGFFDWGNVFAKPADLRLAEFRETLGVGGRYDTPVGPVRIDLAWLLDRRPGEDPLQIFVSVGHTF